MKKRKVAIFDIDGTIFRSSLLIELVHALIEAGIFPNDSIEEFRREHELWLDRKGDYESYIMAVVDTFQKYLIEVSFSDFNDISKKMVLEHKNRVYRYTRDLVLELKKADFFLLAISQSPKGVLDSFCNELGFDKVYGRFYELGPQDTFTGEIVDLHLIANKANIVRRAVEKNNLTLQGSVGVGDTEGDIPFLELVERPICFNPNKKLYKWAIRNNAKIIVERKDVIYDISKSKDTELYEAS